MEKIFITGHRGMVGSALMRHTLSSHAFKHGGIEILTAGKNELDLRSQAETFKFLKDNRPDIVIVAAAKVGGIHANSTYPADFIYDNLAIATNVIEGSRRAEVPRLLFLGSSCIYPKFAPQPISESSILTSALEETNEAYALAKIAGLKLCEHYRKQHGLCYHSIMPTNLYGPGDNYHPENSHVIPGLIRRFNDALIYGDPTVSIWGSGTPRREFLHVDDLASACFHALDLPNPPDLMNVGSGTDLTILELAQLIAKTIGYKGEIITDPSMPDGTPRKLLDISKIQSTGWKPTIPLDIGLKDAYSDYLKTFKFFK